MSVTNCGCVLAMCSEQPKTSCYLPESSYRRWRDRHREVSEMTSAAEALAALDRDDKARLKARRKALDALLKARPAVSVVRKDSAARIAKLNEQHAKAVAAEEARVPTAEAEAGALVIAARELGFSERELVNRTGLALAELRRWRNAHTATMQGGPRCAGESRRSDGAVSAKVTTVERSPDTADEPLRTTLPVAAGEQARTHVDLAAAEPLAVRVADA